MVKTQGAINPMAPYNRSQPLIRFQADKSERPSGMAPEATISPLNCDRGMAANLALASSRSRARISSDHSAPSWR